MKTVQATKVGRALIGHSGENEVVRVQFPLDEFEAEFPNGRASLYVQRFGDKDAYPAVIDIEGTSAYWTITSADSAKPGHVRCELQWIVNDIIVKSDIYGFYLLKAIDVGQEPPDEPTKRWTDRIEEKIGDLNKLETDAKNDIVSAINEAASKGGGGKKDWAQNDPQAADYVENRPGAYMSEPVETEVYNSVLKPMAFPSLDFIPKAGEVITMEIDGVADSYTVEAVTLEEGGTVIAFGSASYEEVAGENPPEDYVLFAHRDTLWYQLAAGSYLEKTVIVKATMPQPVQIDKKYIPKEGFKISVSANTWGDDLTILSVSATYAEIKKAIAEGRTPYAVLNDSVFLHLTPPAQDMHGYGFLGYYTENRAYFFNIYEVGKRTLERRSVLGASSLSSNTPVKAGGNGSCGKSDRVARADHQHPSELPAVQEEDNGKVLKVVGGKWVPGDGMIRLSAEDVFFTKDLVLTETFGRYKPVGGKVTVPASDKSVQEVLLDAYSQDKNPTVVPPSVSVKSTTARAYEVGTSVSPIYVGSLNAGSYEYGPIPTGVAATSWLAVNTATEERLTTATGTFADYIVPDGANYKITVSCTYGDGEVPLTALGQAYKAGKISGATKSATTAAITGYRNSFYGTTTDKAAETTSAVVRKLAQKSGRAYSNGTSFNVTVPVGALRVLIAYPATLRELTSIKDVNGLNADITGAFAKSVVAVEGAGGYRAIDYRVYTLDFANPNDTKNTFAVTI